MANACLDCDLRALNDRVIPLTSLSGSLANDLAQSFRSCSCVEAKVDAIETRLNSLPSINKIQAAIGALVGHNGRLTLDDFAATAGISARQLRRACLKHSGLAPKHLARILRFRYALGQLHSGAQNMAELAHDCGYCDQAHMIRDFHELAGMSPGRYLRQHSR
jgi:AraC-like DNA-binding protein